MKGLAEYINESIENGKYLDLPINDIYRDFYAKPNPPRDYFVQRSSSDSRKRVKTKKPEWQYKNEMEYYEKRLAEWKKEKAENDKKYKEHVSLVKKINSDNLDILIDKILKVMKEPKRREDFIKDRIAAGIEWAKNNELDVEKFGPEKNPAIRNLNALVKGLEKSIATSRNNLDKYSKLDPTAESIYEWVKDVARLYNIDVPKFSNLENDLFVPSLDDAFSKYLETHGNILDDDAKYYAAKEKIQQKLFKDGAKVLKFRKAWANSEQYKNIQEIINVFKEDIEKIEKGMNINYDKYYAKIKADKEYLEMSNKMAPIAKEEIKKYFQNTVHAVSCYGKSLVDVLTAIGLAGKEYKSIKPVDSGTTGWISGMKKYCKFEVTDEDGNTYLTGKYEDRGFDSFGGGQADGFSPWD